MKQTALETLQKYNLKTDVKSVMERIFGGRFSYDDFVIANGFYNTFDELRSADLALLCELAEKGERYENIRKRAKAICDNPPYGYFTENQIADIISEIITESEGEPR